MPYKDKERKRAYAQRPENKERKRAYAQRPENKERKRAYAQRPENKERQRAYAQRYHSDVKAIKRRLELDDSGISSILAAIADGERYIDIAADWLITEADVGDIARAHGLRRRRSPTSTATILEAR